MSVDIIYSIATGRVRRIIAPSSGHPLHAGEAILKATDSQYLAFTSPGAIQSFVNAATGKVPSGDRYVLVDNGSNVVNAVIADPLSGDTAPAGLTLVAHATATRGDLWLGGRLLPNTPLANAGSRQRRKRP